MGNTQDPKVLEKLEKHEKKLALIAFQLDKAEKRIDEKVKELDNKLQALSTLTSHIETFLEDAKKTRPRRQGYNRRPHP